MPLNTAQLEEAFTSREDGIKKLLSHILNFNLQHETKEKPIINIINRLLSTARHRKEGLEYLNLIINNCGSSVILENALNWVNHCIIKFPDDILRELKLRILGEIIEVSHNEADFNKKFISDHVAKVLDNCLTTSHVNSCECKTALKTLTICMQHYPSWFGTHKPKVESFILIFLESPNKELVQAAAVAFHYLQQVGNAGSNGTNHKLNFTQNFEKLCRTVHELYDKFFENERELFQGENSEGEVFEFQDDPSTNSLALVHVNARRILNMFLFIEIMIKNKYPVAKETRPKLLLEVINRALSLHKCISGDSEDSLETYQFSLLLLEIQCAALKLLRLFVVWYQTNCLPFSYSISRVIVDCIEKSHNCDCFHFNSLYQETAYKALSEWISIAKSSLHPQFQSQILKCILKDITPLKAQVTLTISESSPSGKKSQKAKRRAMAHRIISSGNQSSNRDSATIYVKLHEGNKCRFALVALRKLLEYTKLNVKANLLKNLYKSIFDSLNNIQIGKASPLYSDPQCQEYLYKVLVAIYHQNTLPILPPLHATISILNRGAIASNRFVANICQEGLRILESFCQPVCPSLYVGLDKDGEEEDSIRLELDEGSEEVNECEVGSVDFDTYTEEFQGCNKSSPQDYSAETTPYHVRYTDTDRSSADDGLSDKGTVSEEIEVEELDPNVPQKRHEETEMKISEFPVVTAPSEDGEEILEGHYKETRFDTIPEEKEKALIDEHRQDISEPSTRTRETVDTDTIKPQAENETEPSGEVVDSGPETSKQDASDLSEIPTVDQEVPQVIEEPLTTQPEITPEGGVVESSVKRESVSPDYFETPAAKRVRFAVNSEDLDGVGTTKNGDSDSSLNLDDDSFIDEVRNYY